MFQSLAWHSLGLARPPLQSRHQLRNYHRLINTPNHHWTTNSHCSKSPTFFHIQQIWTDFKSHFDTINTSQLVKSSSTSKHSSVKNYLPDFTRCLIPLKVRHYQTQATPPDPPLQTLLPRGQIRRLLFRLLLLEWRFLLIGSLGLLLSSTSMILPAATGYIIDTISNPNPPYELNLLLIGLAVLFTFSSITTFIRSYFFNLAGFRLLQKLRMQLLNVLLAKDISFFDSVTSGELVNRLSMDTDLMTKGLIDTFTKGFRRIVEGLGSFIFLLYLQPKLFFTMSIVFPPILILGYFYTKITRRLSMLLTDKSAAATSFAEERLMAIRTVHMLGQEARESRQYEMHLDSILDTAKETTIWNSSFFSLIFYSVNMAMLFVLYQGSVMVMSGIITTGELTSFMLYTIYVGISFSTFGHIYSGFVKTMGSSQRVFDLIYDHRNLSPFKSQLPPVSMENILAVDPVDQPPSDPNPSSAEFNTNFKSNRGTPLVQSEPIRFHTSQNPMWNLLDKGDILFQDVAFSYPCRPQILVLNGLNLSIANGQTLALVGRSGSGKSTIISLCLRFYNPNSGEIFFNNQPLSTLDVGMIRKSIGVVPQDITLFSGTIASNIAYGFPSASMTQIQQVAKEANAHDFIRKLPKQYETPVGQRGVVLSGGQRQRIAIARALIQSPAMLILDEATSSLDVESEFLVQEALRRLMRGRTVLVIAHRLSTIRNADQIAVLHDGKASEIGTFEELTLKNGFLQQMFSKQEIRSSAELL